MHTLFSNQSILMLGKNDQVMQRLRLLCRQYGSDILVTDLIRLLLQ